MVVQLVVRSLLVGVLISWVLKLLPRACFFFVRDGAIGFGQVIESIPNGLVVLVLWLSEVTLTSLCARMVGHVAIVPAISVHGGRGSASRTADSSSLASVVATRSVVHASNRRLLCSVIVLGRE